MSAIAARRARLAAAVEVTIASTPTITSSVESPSDLQEEKSGIHDTQSSNSTIENARKIKRRRGLEVNNIENADDVIITSSIDSGFESHIKEDDGMTSLMKIGTFEPILNQNMKVSNDGVICALKSGETMHLIGTGTLKVLDGQVRIAGAIFTAEHREAVILAPITSPLPVVMGIGEKRNTSALEQYGFDETSSFSAIVRLSEYQISGVTDLHSVCNQITSNSFSASTYSHTCWPLINFAPQALSNKAIIHSSISDSWRKTLDQSVKFVIGQSLDPSIFLIRGPKRVGKSTLSRILLQRLLTVQRKPVAYLETDLGQSEFGLPGMVSLHIFDSASQAPILFAPSWCSMRQAHRAHFIGDTTPKNDPGAYITAVQNLIETYRHSWEPIGIPLIVNTQGWVKGLGAELLAQLEEMIRPSVILDVSEDCEQSTENDHPYILNVQASPAIYTRERSMNAVEMRSLNVISYFYSRFLPSSFNVDLERQRFDLPVWSTSQTLLERCPYSIDVEKGLQGGIHIMDLACSVSEKNALATLNGSCVAIIISEGVEQQESIIPSTSSAKWLASIRKSLPNPIDSTCIGLGIVRSLDLPNGRLHLLSPVNPAFFSTSSTTKISISKGSLDIPVCLSLDKTILQSLSNPSKKTPIPSSMAEIDFPNIPYLDFDTTITDADIVIDMKKRRIRRNLLRPSQHGQ